MSLRQGPLLSGLDQRRRLFHPEVELLEGRPCPTVAPHTGFNVLPHLQPGNTQRTSGAYASPGEEGREVH